MADSLFPVTCAWCQKIAGHSSVPKSHGICASCYEQLLGVPHLSQEQLDALPFGVIQLDSHGVVLAYNRAESELSGRSAVEVVGCNFFTDIAPCTAVRGFKDRFNAAVAEERSLESFSFPFRFPGRTAMVEIVFVRGRPGTIFVTVRQSTTGFA